VQTGEALAHSVGDAKAAYAAYAARAYLNFDYETALLPECNSLDEVFVLDSDSAEVSCNLFD
jgi:hypothetical protein